VQANWKRINVRIALLLTVLIVLLGLWIQLNRSASQRQALAELWSGASAQFVATGIANKTLQAELPSAGQAEDDAFVDSILRNQKIMGRLRAAGFSSIKFGQRKEHL
jgi:hypothetical protein